MKADGTLAEKEAHYKERFVTYLETCAHWRFAKDLEPFMVASRKALEAALLAVQARTQQAKGLGSMEGLLDQLFKTQPPQMSAQEHAVFNVIRTQTNPAAHVPAPTDQIVDVDRVARELPVVARWMVSRGCTLGDSLRSRMDKALRSIAGDPRLEPPDLAAEKLSQQFKDLVAERDKLVAEREKLTLSYSRAKARIGVLEMGGMSPARVLQAALRPVGLAAAAILGVLGGVVIANLAMGPPAAFPGTTVVALPSAAAAVSLLDAGNDASVLPDAFASVPVEEMPEADDASDATCPSGMTLVESTRVALAQPIRGRGAWPPPRPNAVAPQHVPRFCLHRLELTQGEFDSWRRSTGRSHPSECGASGRHDYPAICVTDEEAAAFCADHEWSLPSIAQWEAVARSGGARTSPGTSEWVVDLFPPQVFNRSGCGRGDTRCEHRMIRGSLLDTRPTRPAALFSWNAPNVAAIARRDLSFRCASPPTEANRRP